jgi:hypothetical protein
LPIGVEQKLAEYCVEHGVTKSDAVKQALYELLQRRHQDAAKDHPFVGGDEGDGTDVSGNIKVTLRARFRNGKR